MILAGVQIEHIPYRGATAMVQAAITWDAPLVMANLSSVNAYLQQGELLPLAVTSLERSQELPDVPSLNEVGLNGFDTIAWNGMFGPPARPADIVNAVNAEMVRVAALPEARERVRALGVEIVASTPDALGERVQNDIARWKNLVARTGIIVD